MKVAVIGGSGSLGRALLPHLANHQLVVASRHGDVRADIRTGEGLKEALQGSEVVVHLASDPRRPRQTDVEGTRNLLDAMGGQHLVYLSIVGVDRHPFHYYRSKRAAEISIEHAGNPYTIMRATQFHPFIHHLLTSMCRRWMAFVPSGFVFQPIDIGEVAVMVANVVHSEPAGLLPDLAGPEILGIDELARSFMEARGREAPLVRFPVPGKVGRAFRDGVHTNGERSIGRLTWGSYLEGIRAG